jgi:hypothetical protein
LYTENPGRHINNHKIETGKADPWALQRFPTDNNELGSLKENTLLGWGE